MRTPNSSLLDVQKKQAVQGLQAFALGIAKRMEEA